jgi:GT2 family glycosyltransferase
VPFDAVRLLARVRGEPAGFVQVPLTDGRLDHELLAERVARELGVAVAVPATGAGGGPDWLAATRATPVSVIVCTRDRAGQLARCLGALRRLDHDDLEIVVVDNAPAGDAAARLVATVASGDARVRYLREDRPGLSCARNCGLREARADIVAFTDDDVRVDPLWAAALVRGFARDPRVACVTGLVASAALGLPEERYFDARVSWSSSCERRTFAAARGAGDSPLHPYSAGVFGTGANMAFRAAALRATGGFDECLGAGSPAGGGEDLDAFLRVLLDGGLIAYEPAALVWHEHRAAAGDLDRQMFDYGKGFTAYLFKHATSWRSACALASRLLPGVAGFARLGRRFHGAARDSGVAGRAPLWEVAGFLAGPFAYRRARQVAARATRMS